MKKRLVLTFVLMSAMASAACATRPALEVASQPGEIEAVQAAAFTRDTVLMKVASNGCTDKDDIKPFITMLKSRAVMTLLRMEEDTCTNERAEGVLLQWSFDELGLVPGTEVEVSNPYLMPRDAS